MHPFGRDGVESRIAQFGERSRIGDVERANRKGKSAGERAQVRLDVGDVAAHDEDLHRREGARRGIGDRQKETLERPLPSAVHGNHESRGSGERITIHRLSLFVTRSALARVRY